ncbi:hypothetical protein [Nostoc sp.]|uniref:hypothetical protein n=1 Tax=Nostoc sp. TaxID=1180 RepID=UPI002FFB1583
MNYANNCKPLKPQVFRLFLVPFPTHLLEGATRFCEIGAIRWLEIKPIMDCEGLAAGL